MDFYDRNRFSDYIDYRMHRRHRGALVRDILNQVELNRGPLGLGRQPILSVGPMYGSMERLNDLGTGCANPNDVTYRALPDLGEPAFRAMPPYPLTSKRYPFCTTMDNLASDIQQGREQYSPEPTRFSTPPPEVARVHGTTLMTGFQDDHRLPDYYFLGRARDPRPIHTKPLDEIATPLFYTRPQQPFAARLHSPELEIGPELIAHKRNEDFPFKRYRASFTPYAPYRNVHTPVSKRLNPEWMTYKPYEYRWHQFRYVYEPEPFSTIKDMEMFRITRPKQYDLLFKKMDCRKWDKTPAFDALRKEREEILKRKQERQSKKVHVDEEPYIRPKRDLTSISPAAKEPKPRSPRYESSMSAMDSKPAPKRPATPPPSPELVQTNNKPSSVLEDVPIPDPIPEPKTKAEPEGEQIVHEEPKEKKKRKKLIMSTGKETQDDRVKPTPDTSGSQIISEERPIDKGNNAPVNDPVNPIPNSENRTPLPQKLEPQEPQAKLAEPEPQEPEPEDKLAKPEPQQPEPEAKLAEPELQEPEAQANIAESGSKIEPSTKTEETWVEASNNPMPASQSEPLAEPSNDPEKSVSQTIPEPAEESFNLESQAEPSAEPSNDPEQSVSQTIPEPDAQSLILESKPEPSAESSNDTEQVVSETIPEPDGQSRTLESKPDQEALTSGETNSKEINPALNLEPEIGSADSETNDIEPIAKIEQEPQAEEHINESQPCKEASAHQDDTTPQDSIGTPQTLEETQGEPQMESEQESKLGSLQTMEPKSMEQITHPKTDSPSYDQASTSTMVEEDPKPALDNVHESNDTSVSTETPESAPSRDTMPTGIETNGKPEEVLIQDETAVDETAVVEPVEAPVAVKPSGQILIDERDLGENESIRTEYEIEAVEITP